MNITIAHLRYYLVGYRPSQTNNNTHISATNKWSVTAIFKQISISPTPITKLLNMLHSLTGKQLCISIVKVHGVLPSN